MDAVLQAGFSDCLSEMWVTQLLMGKRTFPVLSGSMGKFEICVLCLHVIKMTLIKQHNYLMCSAPQGRQS